MYVRMHIRTYEVSTIIIITLCTLYVLSVLFINYECYIAMIIIAFNHC